MNDNDILWKTILKSEFDINKIDNLRRKHGFLALLVHDKRGYFLLHWAVILGLNELVVYLLNNGVPVDLAVKIKEEPLPIHLAALEGRLRIIDILIKYGTNINAVDKKGCTPLMRAAMYGFNVDTKTSDTILFLLSRGANPKLIDHIGFSTLHHATFFEREDAVSLLITLGMDVNQRDNDGFKPLDIALYTQNRYTIEELAQYTIEAKNGLLDDIIRKCSKRKWTEFFDLILTIFARTFVFCLVITAIFWSYPQYYFNYYPASKDLYLLHIVILTSSTCLWICWFRTMRKNPGYLSIDSEEYYNILEYKLNLGVKNQMHQVIPEDIYKDVNLCHICRTLQPVRSKHCRFCRRCTEYFDHHCMYLNNCIGKCNRLSFLCLIFHMLFVGLLYLSLIFIVIKRYNWSMTYQHLANIMFAGKLILIGGLLTVCTVRRAMINLTANEELKKDSYKYLKNQNGSYFNQFDKGFWGNLKDYFNTSAFFVINKNHLFNRSEYRYQKL